MNRAHAKQLLNTLVAEATVETYPVAEQELRNWAEWQRTLPNPIPRGSSKSSSLFGQIKSKYPDAPRVTFEPDIPRAEICEKLITSVCTTRHAETFVQSYVYGKSNEAAALSVRSSGHKANRGSYPTILKEGMKLLEEAYMGVVQ